MGAQHHGYAIFRSPLVQWVEIKSELGVIHARAVWSARTQERREAVQDDQVVVLLLLKSRELVLVKRTPVSDQMEL